MPMAAGTGDNTATATTMATAATGTTTANIEGGGITGGTRTGATGRPGWSIAVDPSFGMEPVAS